MPSRLVFLVAFKILQRRFLSELQQQQKNAIFQQTGNRSQNDDIPCVIVARKVVSIWMRMSLEWMVWEASWMPVVYLSSQCCWCWCCIGMDPTERSICSHLCDQLQLPSFEGFIHSVPFWSFDQRTKAIEQFVNVCVIISVICWQPIAAKFFDSNWNGKIIRSFFLVQGPWANSTPCVWHPFQMFFFVRPSGAHPSCRRSSYVDFFAKLSHCGSKEPSRLGCILSAACPYSWQYSLCDHGIRVGLTDELNCPGHPGKK